MSQLAEKDNAPKSSDGGHTPTNGSIILHKHEHDHDQLGEDDIEKRRKQVLRKMDVHLLPFISLLYLLSFLDRSNVGNAKIGGMAHDLNLHGFQYNIIAAVFFIPYAFAEVPSNIALKLVRPSIWIPSIMVAWGIVMTLMALVTSFEGLLAARVFLGLTEAGLFPGITFYLSLWYRKRDVASRIAIFFSAATIAGAFGGILAWGIEHMDGIGDLHGWQWIFCLEGLVTVAVAFASYFFMYDYPETANFLNEEEKRIVAEMLKEDSQGQAKRFAMKFVWQAMRDYKTYVQSGIYMGLLIPLYAIALFTPTIVNELGYEAHEAQLLTVPPFVCGCIVTIMTGVASDRLNIRGPFIMSGCFISMIGYIVLYTQTSPGACYAGAILTATGVYPCIAVTLAWVGSSAGGDTRKGVVYAMVIGLGNLGGICSSFIYITPPRFLLGHGIIMGWLSLAILLAAFSMWDYNRINKKKEAYCRQHGIDSSRQAEFAEMGSESPLFRYTL